MLVIFIMMLVSLTCIGALSIVFPMSLLYAVNALALVVSLCVYGIYAMVSRKGFAVSGFFPGALLYFYGIPLIAVQPILLDLKVINVVFMVMMLIIFGEKVFRKGLHFDHGKLKCKTGALFASILVVSAATIGICKYQSWWLFGVSLGALLAIALLARRHAHRLIVCVL